MSAALHDQHQHADTTRQSQKMLIQMSGAPGAGKSTIAAALAKAIDGVVINHDLFKAFFLERENSFERAGQLAYDLDWVVAEDLIRQGRSVIIDSVCNYVQVIERGTALAVQYGYAYKYVECRLPDHDRSELLDTLDQRLRERVPLRSQRAALALPPRDATVSSPSEQLDPLLLFDKWLNPQRPANAQDAMVVDSSLPLDVCLKHILRSIFADSAETVQS